ncbi:MAG: BrnT family toxin [Sphingomonadaceae bacterium]|nr:BrnT family toxin [Sphingomonadaceae bacterium]
MEISFDPDKRTKNLQRHGLDLADAAQLLSRPCVELPDERFDYDEDRWVSVGLLDRRVVVCVWADWGNVHRVISLRRATANEQDWYFREIGGASG